MRPEIPIVIERNAISRLIPFCEAAHLEHFMLVADQNTYSVLGERVEGLLKGRGFDVETVTLTGDEVLADERYIAQVFFRADATQRVYLAVGSGTITDIARFVSHRSRTSFISLPTAPSVDGFTSIVAPLVLDGLKVNAQAHPPVAVFADLDVLCAAPQSMIAAGFGDMVGKFTSLADWRLGNLLWGERYSEPIAHKVRTALNACAARVDEIGHGSEEGVRYVMEGLIESGLCMVEFGTSQPASGAEHHLSHYWEMKLLREGRRAILHGAKVGAGVVLAAQRYDRIRQMTRQELLARLEAATLPDRAHEEDHIRTGYGAIADQVIATQEPFLSLTEEAFNQLKQSIVSHWDAIQAIAATVPPSEEIADMIRRAGGMPEPSALGLTDEDVSMAQKYSHYLRNNLTIMKLAWILGI